MTADIQLFRILLPPAEIKMVPILIPVFKAMNTGEIKTPKPY